MSQMYEVSFQTHFANSVDVGKALVCAPSQEGAIDMAMQLLDLPRSCTRCEVRRIKPSIWQLERREIVKDEPGKRPSRPMPISEFKKYHLQVDAVMSVRNEKQIMRRVGESLVERASGRKTEDGRSKTLDIIVECAPLGQKTKPLTPMERIEVYRPSSVPGGRTHGR